MMIHNAFKKSIAAILILGILLTSLPLMPMAPAQAREEQETSPFILEAPAPQHEEQTDANHPQQAEAQVVDMPPPPYVNLQVTLESNDDIEHLDAILQELEARGWTAAFYVTLDVAADHADALQDLLASGQELGVVIDELSTELSAEEQAQQLDETLAAVREAVELSDDHLIHVRLRDYVNHYTKLVETVKALESLGVASMSGVIGVDEGFSCQYCVENSRLMYPLPAEDALDLTLIPVSVAEESADPVPLDDARFQATAPDETRDPAATQDAPPSPADMFAAAQAKYDSFAPPAPNLMQADAAAEATDETNYVHDKYLTLIVHPSITGADEEAMAGFTAFLDRVEEQSGTLVSTQQILDVTAQMMAAGYIGSLDINKGQDETCPNEKVNLTVNWTALLYCPTYYFRIYGKYPSESAWKLLYQTSHYVRTGSYSFNATATVPNPPTPNDDFYTFMVVGQSCSSGHEGCGFPTVQSHERNSTTSVDVKTCIDLEVKDRDIYVSTPAKRGDDVTAYAWIYNNGEQDAENVEVRIQDLAYGQPWNEETKTIASIPAGGRTKVSLPSSVWNVNIHKYIFTADPNNKIEEEDEDNNRGETHTITGKVTDEDNKPLKHLKVEYVRGGSAHYADFTDGDGKYVINSNLDVIQHNVNGAIRARLEYSPEDRTDKIKSKFYDDTKWDAGRKETYYKDTAAWPIKRDQDYSGKDVEFTWQQGGRTYSTLVQAFEYFKNLSATSFSAPNMTFEFMDDDYASKTSYQSGDTIHMWETHTDDRCIHTHEYAHRVSNSWKTPYNPIDENWANYASSLGRGTANHDSSICVADIASDANTDADDGWFWQLSGVYWDLTRDTVIATLKNDSPSTVKGFYDDYKARDSGRTNAQIQQIFRNHGYNTTGWTLVSAAAPMAMLAGGAEFTDAYSHATYDTDSDTRWDSLVISVGLNITTTGTYEVLGFLGDGSGKNCFARYAEAFDTGSQVAPLAFEGTCIYQKALTGTYSLVDLAVQDTESNLSDYRLNAHTIAQPYAYTDFQQPVVVPTGTYSEQVEDTDGDAEYNTLSMDIGLDVSEALTLSVSADLYDDNGDPVATSETGGIVVTPGTHTVTLDFEGQDLYAYGYDGAYTLRTLTVVSDEPCECHGKLPSAHNIFVSDPADVLYTTQVYSHTQFESPDAEFVGPTTDYGEDTDGDGLYNRLTVQASLSATAEVSYTVLAELTRDDTLVANTSYSITSGGLHTVTLHFDGINVRRSRMDGPYTLTLRLRDDNRACLEGGLCQTGAIALVTTTDAYNYTAFQLPPEDHLTIAYGDHGSDDDSDSLYDALTVDLDVSAARALTYTFAGSLADDSGQPVAYAQAVTALDAATQTVSLDFPGGDIWRTMDSSGSYILDLTIEAPTGQHLLTLQDVYTTGAYAYTEFESPGARFTDGYADQGTDANGDGLYDYLDVDVDVQTSVSGTYRLAGLLTDSGGGFLAEAEDTTGLSAGSHTLQLRFDGMAIRQSGVDGPYALRDLALYDADSIPQDSQTAPYTTTAYTASQFQSGGVLSGTILGPTDAASQTLVLVEGPISRSDRAGRDGRYWIGSLYSGTYTMTVTPPPNLNLLGTSQMIDIQAEQATIVNLTLTAGAIISGTVRDEAGQVVPDVTILVTGPTNATTQTDANGRYIITRLPAGSYQVYAVPDESSFLKDANASRYTNAGGTYVVDFTLEAVGGIIGRVTDENGDPLQAEIDLGGYEPPHYPTDADGYYYITGLSPGEYNVHINSDPAYNDWWMYVDERHADNGEQVTAQVVEGRTTVVDFQRPPTTPVADLYVDKSLHAGVVGFDEEITYRIRVRNLGNLEVTGIVVTDTLPAGATYVSESHPGDFGLLSSGSQTVWSKGSLPAYGQPGYQAELFLTARLPSSLVAGDLVTNTLDAVSGVSEGDDNNNAYVYAQTAITPTRDLYVDKYLYSGTPLPGGDIQYRIFVQNNGNSAAPDVRITDTLPLSTTYVTHQSYYDTFTAQVVGNQVIWSSDSFASSGYEYLYLTVHISDTVAPGTMLTNTVEASTSRSETDDTNNIDTISNEVQARTRDMYVSKAKNAGQELAGTAYTYQLTVRNEGNTATGNVVLTDTLPVSMTYLSSYNTTYFPNYAYNLFSPNVSGNVITWDLGTVPPNGYGYFYVTALISDTVMPDDVLTNTAQIATGDTESDYADNRSDFPITILAPTYDMGVSKSRDKGSASPGSDLTYRIYYRNYGNSPCENVVITDTLPPEVDYVSYSGDISPTVQGQQVAWDLGTVPGQYNTGYDGYLYLTVRIPEGTAVGTTLTNTVVVTTTTVETSTSSLQSNSDTDVQTVAAPTPDVYLSKSIYNSQLVQGSEATYRLYYQNYGNSAALDTVVTDTLPAGVSFISADPPATAQGDQVVWDLGRVSGSGYDGYYGYLYLDVFVSDAVAAGTTLTNTAIITTPYDTNPTNNNSAYSGAVITGTRDLYLSKGHYSGYFVAGNEVTYRLYYVNQGNASAQDVVITDTLPAEASYVSHDGSFTPTVDGDEIVWDLGTVPGQYNSGYYGYLYLTVGLDTGLQPGDTITNTAIIATSQEESDESNNSTQYAASVVAPYRDVGISKSLYDGEVMANSVITYRLYFDNSGNATAANVRLTDTLPISTTYEGSYTQISYTGDTFTPSVDGRVVTWDLGSVPPSSGGYIYLAARIADGVTSGQVLTNTASIATSDPETYLWDNSATLSNTAWEPDAYEPDDTYSQAEPIAKDGTLQSHNFHREGDEDWLTFDGTIGKEYVIETSNLGSEADTYLYLYTSDGATLVASDYSSGEGSASRIIWVADHSDTYYLKVKDAWNDYGVNVTYDIAVQEYDPAPDLMVEKSHSGLMRGGEVVTYTIDYANQGTAAASNVVLTDTLPEATVYSSDDEGGVPDASGRVIVWDLGSLASGDSDTIAVHVHVSETLRAGTWVTNHVEIATPVTERRYDNNAAQHGTEALTPWGGPDAFGYIFKASNRPGGPVYDWIDIASGGTEVWPGENRDDSSSNPLPIGFAFPFYGNAYSQLYVGSNGYVSFGSGYTNRPWGTLPSTGWPNNDIMPFGGDMYHTGGTSHVYYQQLSNPDRFVVQFDDLDYYSPRGHFATFQIVLYTDGTILTQYRDVDMDYPPSVVGIENITGTVGLDYGTNVFSGLAIKYYPPALTPAPQRIELEAAPTRIPVDGHTATVTATVYDQYDAPIPDGTVVSFTTDLGTIPASTTTTDGVATALLTSGSDPGLATVTAQAGQVSEQVQVEFVAQTAKSIGPAGGVITATRGDVAITFPAGAVSVTTYLTLTDYYAIDDVPGGFGFAGHAFGLIAVDAAGDPVPLDAPITVTVRYSDTDVVGMNENALELTYWTGSAWEDAACGEYDRHPGENWLAVPICHLTDFALLGPWVSISEVSIDGPTTGQTASSYVFTATVSPGSAATPITYTWEATDKTPVVHTEQGIEDTISFTWAISGTKHITVTASNVGGSDIATHTITIEEGEYDIYLPLVARNYP